MRSILQPLCHWVFKLQVVLEVQHGANAIPETTRTVVMTLITWGKSGQALGSRGLTWETPWHQEEEDEWWREGWTWGSIDTREEEEEEYLPVCSCATVIPFSLNRLGQLVSTGVVQVLYRRKASQQPEFLLSCCILGVLLTVSTPDINDISLSPCREKIQSCCSTS